MFALHYIVIFVIYLYKKIPLFGNPGYKSTYGTTTIRYTESKNNVHLRSYITPVPFCGGTTQRYRRNQKNNVHLS